jgi:2-hydroxy-6-oxonona-2,4-dienedioate hydrolase
MIRSFATATALLILFATIVAAQTPAMTEKDATVLGFRLHYREAGRGAPVVLLHGLGGDGSRWAPNVGPLATDFHVIALDQIGFGQSDKPLANYHVGMLSEFLVDFLKAIGVPKASLVGNSLGAWVAAYTAVHHPNAVDRLVLADGAGYKASDAGPAPDPHLRQLNNGVTREETREWLRHMFHDKSLATEEMVDENLAMRLRSAFTISKLQDAGENGLGGIADEEMRSIQAPTLILWGKYDEVVGPPERTGERLHRDIRGSRLIVIDNASHFPQLEHPEEFNRIVRQFLKTLRCHALRYAGRIWTPARKIRRRCSGTTRPPRWPRSRNRASWCGNFGRTTGPIAASCWATASSAGKRRSPSITS